MKLHVDIPFSQIYTTGCAYIDFKCISVDDSAHTKIKSDINEQIDAMMSGIIVGRNCSLMTTAFVVDMDGIPYFDRRGINLLC